MSSRIDGADPRIRANKLDLLERVADDLAHEIKNPLHSMVINLEVLKRRISRVEAAGAEDMLRYADVLGSELERVVHRVDLLLRMVRPGRDDSIALQDVLDEIRDLVEVEGARRSIRVRFVGQGLGGRPTAPREPTRQVVLNMVLAVMDRLPSGGDLQVEAERDEDEIRVRITGEPARPEGAAAQPPAPDAPAPVSALEPGPRLSIVELLGDGLGGRVEARRSGASVSLTLSLPASR